MSGSRFGFDDDYRCTIEYTYAMVVYGNDGIRHVIAATKRSHTLGTKHVPVPGSIAATWVKPRVSMDSTTISAKKNSTAAKRRTNLLMLVFCFS